MQRIGLLIVGVWLAACFGAATIGAQEELDDASCLACHGDPEAPRFVHAETFAASVHGGNTCVSCHSDITAVPHDVPLASVQWQRIPTTCAQCHTDAHAAYDTSIHGQAAGLGRRGAPVCTDCHGAAHAIQPIASAGSTVFASKIPDTCSQCHAAQAIVTRFRLPAHVVPTYMDSFHGLSMQLGSVKAANCASCHGSHAILPSSDPKSTIHPANLPKTCGACHPGVSEQVARGKIHTGGSEHLLEHPAVTFVRRFYLMLIMLVMGGMLMHNALDFRTKLRKHYEAARAAGLPQRMALNERIQHGLLVIAFVTLAYTGFALQYPQGWWAAPFLGRGEWRSIAHRAAAIAFVVLALYHVWFLLGTRRGRTELRALLPRRQDAVDLGQMLAYYLGRRPDRPAVGRYSYAEKLEYWALIWGSFVMVLTGGFMTWQDLTLRWFPKWLFDVMRAMHFYEAVLACLAIVVWHFYWTIFDPDEYPMKLSWTTGQASDADLRHRRPDGEV